MINIDALWALCYNLATQEPYLLVDSLEFLRIGVHLAVDNEQPQFLLQDLCARHV